MYQSLYVNIVVAVFNLILFIVAGQWLNLAAMIFSTGIALSLAVRMFDYQTGYYAPYDKNAY